MKRSLIAISLACLGLAANAQEAAQGRFGVGYGSLGLGVYYSTPAASQWETKFAYVSGNPKFVSFSVSNASAVSTSKFTSFGLIGDYYPIYGSGFRLSLGAYFGSTNTDFSIYPSSTASSINIAGQDVSVSGTTPITGTVKMNDRSFTPYLGVGYTAVVGDNSQFRINVDAGVLFFNPSVSLTTGSATDSSQLIAAQQKILDKANKNKLYQNISIGVDYSF